ncbi:tyramine oxidase subunit B [Acetomicrobium mobile]|uniref:tyramine oxidase subunit B n=1 Tax=Acetomicrobium mobile TaxID=97477 RepID=UPI0026ED54EB|nr:tyramine oxidase subunit B [Acetomicrobium mobile]
MAEVKSLLLSQADLIKTGVLDMPKCVDVIEEVFSLLGKGDYIMGGPKENEHGQMIFFPEEERFPGMPVAGPDRRFMAMIAYLGGRYKVCGEKWYGSNLKNHEKGLPRSILTIILNDADTGVPFTIMSGNLISAMRTGAVPGVAARYLSRSGAKVVGVIGGGVINRACLWAIYIGCPTIKEAYLFDVNPNKYEDFAREIKEKTGIQVHYANSIENAVRPADVITVATSGEVFPRIEKEWIKRGCLVTLTSAADMDLECFTENTVIADNWKMHQAFIADGKEHPKGIDALAVVAPSFFLLKYVDVGLYDASRIRNLGDVVNGDDHGRRNDDEIIILVTGGMPVHDIAWSYHLYEKAKDMGIGTEFVFFDKPYWK